MTHQTDTVHAEGGDRISKIVAELRAAKERYVSPPAPRTGLETQQAYDYWVSLTLGHIDTLLAALSTQERVRVDDVMVKAARAELWDHRHRANNCEANVRRALEAALAQKAPPMTRRGMGRCKLR